MKTRHCLAAIVIIAALFLAEPGRTQTPPFQWAKRIASTVNQDDELAIGLAIDSAANLYVTGWFDGTNNFGNGNILTNRSGGGQDIFVAKYNSAGTNLWARRAGGSTSERDNGRGIGVDSAGNVYVTGGFYGIADFGGTNLSGSTTQQFFIAKYDGGGALKWVKQSMTGGPDDIYGTGLAVDGMGNCYAVGSVNNDGPIRFDALTLSNTTISGESAFLVKYDNKGEVKWAALLNSPSSCYSTGVALDGTTNVYVSGSFRAALHIAATNLSNAGEKDGFVAKFNTAGVLQWARQMAGRADCGGTAVSVGASGSVYAVGGFGNTKGDTNFFGNSITLTNTGGGFPGAGVGDAFLVKYNGSTGVAQWARRAGGTNADAYLGVSTDSRGNVYAGGGASGTGLPNGFNAVIAKYDTNGVVQWTQSSTGTNGAIIFAGPVVDAAGTCYAAGWFQTNAMFGTNRLTGRGYWDFFLAKVGFAPLTLGIRWSNSMPRVSVSGEIGNRFALERVSALGTNNNWQTLLTNTLTTSTLIHTDTNSGGNSRRVYRARLVP